MLNLKDVIDSVFRKATSSRAHTFDLVTLNSAAESNTGQRIRVSAGATPTIEVLNSSAVLRSLSGTERGHLYAVAGAITGVAFSPSQYRNVLDDPHFQKLYGAESRAVSYIRAGTPLTNMELTAPCMVCGLVLPLKYLTVDHQRPQTGGALEAVAKTFRAFGLTKEGPKGHKGAAIQAHVFHGTTPQAVPTMPGRAALGGASVADRYSLNEAGSLLYSFIKEAGKLDDLKLHCLHGLLNLRPACTPCNSGRGQVLRF